MRNMGMRSDVKRRAQLARSDNNRRKINVSSARRIIYEENYAVNSKPVELLLKEDSLVPVSVRLDRLVSFALLIEAIFLECILEQACRIRFQFF